SGSTVLNMYIDRDIDAIMERTKDRPDIARNKERSINRKSNPLKGLIFSTIDMRYEKIVVYSKRNVCFALMRSE
ncbi:MAG: hypothetical protein ACFFE4_18525, partial [Candidatus Thorarchaeota archaeon]